MERAIRFLNETFGARADADFSLLKYWARLEVSFTFLHAPACDSSILYMYAVHGV